MKRQWLALGAAVVTALVIYVWRGVRGGDDSGGKRTGTSGAAAAAGAPGDDGDPGRSRPRLEAPGSNRAEGETPGRGRVRAPTAPAMPRTIANRAVPPATGDGDGDGVGVGGGGPPGAPSAPTVAGQGPTAPQIPSDPKVAEQVEGLNKQIAKIDAEMEAARQSGDADPDHMKGLAIQRKKLTNQRDTLLKHRRLEPPSRKID